MPVLYAHRGAAAELPENTLPAFVRALERGADAIETDAHVTRDGIVVLAHDATGARMAGVRRSIADCDLEEVRRWNVGLGFVRDGERPFAGRPHRVPTLEEALAALPGIAFNVDSKARDVRAVDRIVAEVRRLGAEDRVRLASFRTATLRRARALGYRGETGLGKREVARLIASPLAPLRRFPLGGQAAQIPTHAGALRLDTPRLIEKAHALGIRVDYWTIDEPEEARRLLALGADGIMTNDPARIAPVMRAARGG